MESPILVTRPYLPPKEQFDRLTDEIWKNRWLTNNGPLLCRFEKALSSYLGLPEAALVTNGHLALDIAVKSLNLQGEVITTPFTFASTTHVLVQNHLTPVFCDIDEETLTLDPAKLEGLINERTSAILAVHVYGHPCHVEEIDRLAKKYKLKVIYDAAHAFGVQLKGKSIAEFGDVSAFSFHATKLFHSIEGGLLYAEDLGLRREFELQRNFGIENEILVSKTGGNAKMNEFQAAMGLLVLDQIDDLIRERERLAERYVRNLTGVPGIRYCRPEAGEDFRFNYAYIPVRILPEFGISRDVLYEFLKTKGIYTRRYFYPLTSEFACYKGRFSSHLTPVAKRVAEEILALPIYNGLSAEEVDYICKNIRQARRDRSHFIMNV
ncbi:MAG: DegT/DnrJ/EryC1/StrS family aminotransferase [Lachnospiraceae bacterium]|nr:DegT/DnrJ/EryC1/StrS family aminotransferase [Lachnospiraceae bacterium]